MVNREVLESFIHQLACDDSPEDWRTLDKMLDNLYNEIEDMEFRLKEEYPDE